MTSTSVRASSSSEGKVCTPFSSASPIEKIKYEYRYQVWYFTNGVTRVIADLNALRTAFAWPDDITQVLDVDPVNLT